MQIVEEVQDKYLSKKQSKLFIDVWIKITAPRNEKIHDGLEEWFNKAIDPLMKKNW